MLKSVKTAGIGTYGGGGTSKALSVPGVNASDIAVAVIKASTNSVSINKVVCSTDTVTVTFSGDPGASTTINYAVLLPF